jgi:hypothetical protein
MMDWQQPASLAVVAVAGFLFVRHEIRARKRARSRACGSDCACGAGEGEPGAAPADEMKRE